MPPRLRIAMLLALHAALCGPAPPAAADTTATAGMRTVYLIRHGEYDQDDPRDESVGRGLTARGREQAARTGRRLAALPGGLAALTASTFTRARETAAIAGRVVRLAPRTDPDLRECTPPSERADVMRDLAPGEADSCAAQLERAFARHFRPAEGGDRAEALVCHGNVIRWLTCRALGLEPRAWLRMGLAHCSLTAIQVRPDGSLRLIAFGDAGHLPPALQTGLRARAATPRAKAMR